VIADEISHRRRQTVLPEPDDLAEVFDVAVAISGANGERLRQFFAAVLFLRLRCKIRAGFRECGYDIARPNRAIDSLLDLLHDYCMIRVETARVKAEVKSKTMHAVAQVLENRAGNLAEREGFESAFKRRTKDLTAHGQQN
jgi:hypothetical protein